MAREYGRRSRCCPPCRGSGSESLPPLQRAGTAALRGVPDLDQLLQGVGGLAGGEHLDAGHLCGQHGAIAADDDAYARRVGEREQNSAGHATRASLFVVTACAMARAALPGLAISAEMNTLGAVMILPILSIVGWCSSSLRGSHVV